jgi:hypothetical protein
MISLIAGVLRIGGRETIGTFSGFTAPGIHSTSYGSSLQRGENFRMTKKKILSLLPSAALVLGLAIPAAAKSGAPSPSPAPSPKPAAAAPVPPERHPHIREALAALRSSKEDLEHAAHDFGGHRVEAIRSIEEAIRQLEICLKYDKD